MPSSLRRREERLVLGANKKIRIHSAELGVTVGVIRIVFSRHYTGRVEKANEGAERSSARRPRGRRGLRRGKRRARGRQPRDSLSRQPRPNNSLPSPKSRVIRSHLRMCDFHRRIAQDFTNLVRDLDRRDRFSQPILRGGILIPGVNWKKTKARWERLHSHLVRTSNRLLADTVLSHRFNSFIEVNCRIRLQSAPGIGQIESEGTRSFLDHLSSVLPVRAEAEQPSGLLGSGRTCTGQYCRVCGRKSFRGAPCPGIPVPIPRDLLRRGEVARSRRYPRP